MFAINKNHFMQIILENQAKWNVLTFIATGVEISQKKIYIQMGNQYFLNIMKKEILYYYLRNIEYCVLLSPNSELKYKK